MQLSENFTLAELTRSATAGRLNIRNISDETQIQNLKKMRKITSTLKGWIFEAVVYILRILLSRFKQSREWKSDERPPDREGGRHPD